MRGCYEVEIRNQVIVSSNKIKLYKLWAGVSGDRNTLPFMLDSAYPFKPVSLTHEIIPLSIGS